jgi:hypothetical protein
MLPSGATECMRPCAGRRPVRDDHIDSETNQLCEEGRAVPTMYYRREFAAAGGLMSYGSTTEETLHALGDYTGRILKGAKAGYLPVQQPTKFEL